MPMTTRQKEIYHGGERSIVPEWPGWSLSFQGMVYLQHLFAYDRARAYCREKRVLDVGCGAGFGASHLSAVASSVLGIDTDPDAVEYARAEYSADNVRFETCPIDLLPSTRRFDVVVAFQVIEHLQVAQVEPFVEAVRAVLEADGVLLLTTPNRCRRLHFMEKPWNPYHHQEWSRWGLKRLLRRHFAHVAVYGVSGSQLILQAEWHRGTRVRPIEYFLLSPWVVLRGSIGGWWSSKPFSGKLLPRTRLESGLGSAFRRLVTAPAIRELPWTPPRPYCLSDFRLVSPPGWQCIDLFAESRSLP